MVTYSVLLVDLIILMQNILADDESQLKRVLAHEVVHALGFSTGLFSL